MLDHTEEGTKPGISRRTMIKRTGATAAAAWTLPVLSTLNAKASAQASPVGCADCSNPCGVLCGDSCSCLLEVGGTDSCFCHEGSSCDAQPLCTTSADCPTGLKCAASCCPDLRCLPECGSPFAVAAKTGPGTSIS